MFRLVFATLLGVAQSQGPRCPDCNFDIRAFEEFSTDWELVSVVTPDGNFDGGNTSGMHFDGTSITTGPAPASYVQEHGSIAVHARNLQAALTADVTFGFGIGNGPHQIPLNGAQMNEELHINGAAGQASYHLASHVLNVCFLVDGLPPMARIEHDNIEAHLQQAEEMAPQLAHQSFAHFTLDGEEDMGPAFSHGRLLLTQSSAPAFWWPEHNGDPREERILNLIHPRPSEEELSSLAVKFDNYASSVGNTFGVRACEVTAHSATQTLMAENPDVRDFVIHRIAQHQRRLQAVLQPDSLNTRFNFLKLDGLADLMVPAPAQDCASEALAQVPATTFSAFQAAALISVSSFVMAVVGTSAAMRKRAVTPADDYHQVTA